MYVARLQYTVTSGLQNRSMDANAIGRKEGFGRQSTRTETLLLAETSQVKYDLIGKIAEGTSLTRRTAAAILSGLQPQVFDMFRHNPEEFISKAVKLINEQKATMIVEHISYDTASQVYDSSIFTAERGNGDFIRAYRAGKHIQDDVITDGMADKSVEWRFAESLDRAEEVCVYAKLPRGFHIPTPVGNYSPDWAIAFHEGAVKHIFFVAETKGTMDSMNLRPVEQAKIKCAERLFNGIDTSSVKHYAVKDYQSLLGVMAHL